jgi:hypothetical protein
MKTKYLSGLKNMLGLMVCAGLLFGCQAGQDGEPGPQGPTGAAGAKGPAGIPAADGLPRIKVGSIGGTVSGLRAEGAQFEEPFNFQYVHPANMGIITQRSTGVYDISVYREDSLSTGSLFFYFETDANFANPKFRSGGFDLKKAGTNNQYSLFEANYNFYASNSTYTQNSFTNTISNVAFNTTTGTLTADFDWVVDNTSHSYNGTVNNQFSYVSYNNTSQSRQPMRIKGTFSIPVRQRSYRVKAGQ